MVTSVVLNFDVEQVGYAPMLVFLVARAVELKIGAVEARLASLSGKLLALRETDTVGRGQYPVEADLFGI